MSSTRQDETWKLAIIRADLELLLNEAHNCVKSMLKDDVIFRVQQILDIVDFKDSE